MESWLIEKQKMQLCNCICSCNSAIVRKHGKRKASAEAAAPEKKSRSGTNTTNNTDPRVVIVEDGGIQNGKRKATPLLMSVPGTPACFPPEWFDSRAYWACPTTVYQLGALFYMLLGGHGLFSTTYFFHGCIKINPALSTGMIPTRRYFQIFWWICPL